MENPYKNIKVAVAGCGYWGKNLVRNFGELGSLAAVTDLNKESAAKMAEPFGAKALTWEETLADDSIAAVVISTPAETHAKLAQEAIQAGKHVFCEKPLAISLQDAQDVCELAQAEDKILMVGHLLQHHPAFLKVKEMVADGTLGKLQYIYSHRMNLGKIRREENILWSFAPHDISMILALAGAEPEEVNATGSHFLHETIHDVTTTHLSFSNGIHAHIFVSWLHPFKEQKLVVIGEKGMLVFNDTLPWADKLLHYPHKINWQDGMPVPEKADAAPVPLEESEPLKLECLHFLQSIAEKSAPRTDGWEGLRVLGVLDRAQKSLEKKEKKTMTATDGVFVHDSAEVDNPSNIGKGTKIWHYSHILKDVNIGEDCVIGQNVMVGPDVQIGNNCKIQNNVSVYKGVTLEDGVFCGPSCVFTNVMNPRAEIERKDEFKPTLVKKGTTIGANATIVCGTTLGEYCFIGAGAVVTKDVPDYALMVGNPARRTGWMSRAGAKLDGDLTCPLEGTKYKETQDGRLEPLEKKEKAA